MREDKPHLDGAFLRAFPTEAQRSGLLHRKVICRVWRTLRIRASRLVARAERCRLAGRNNHYGNEQGISQDKPLQVVPAYHLEYTLMHHDGKNFD